MTRVKVCGVTREADRRAAVEAGADAVGVVAEVTVDTPRAVTVDRARRLLDGLPPLVTGVLVTMPSTIERALDLARTVDPDAIQLHGDVPPADVAAIGGVTDAAVFRAVDADDPEEASRHDGPADALVLDSTTPEGAGGTGRTHDWERARDLVAELDAPVLLAGGLTPDNVAEAAATVDPFAVDVSSGVERSGGVKDHDAVERFVRTARSQLARP